MLVVYLIHALSLCNEIYDCVSMFSGRLEEVGDDRLDGDVADSLPVIDQTKPFFLRLRRSG